MKKEIREMFPSWCEDRETKFELVLSDDIDSLMCYTYQREKFDREVKRFFDAGAYTDYQIMYRLEDYKNENSSIGLDIALEGEIKCWDNHVVKYSKDDYVNPNSANMNKNICNYNYYSKYIVSSFITMLSYYDEDLTTWSKDQLAVLCAIDGLYTPFLSKYGGRFVSTARKNLDDLGYGYLADFMIENLKYIEQIKRELKLDAKIKMVNGHLETGMDLEKLSEIFCCNIELPSKKFKKIKSIKRVAKPIAFSKDSIDKGLFNFSLTNKGYCCFSYTEYASSMLNRNKK
ncbi:hypothetical protein [Clostridium cibarium]|uniref:Uncharacterized protein n=1 Tax=Clostridium cibarium TaxID=2762247 RepID=A0ABR8PNH4_9CLOT|nr:hypothetical protein [Clostridium cibarium]MBD7909737.1 hypothetical protein [Clostridium cibarium]